ncbi:hypothetical protein CF205_000038 [Escherichia coli]|nr:hypothetical protein [Escherichia coli]
MGRPRPWRNDELKDVTHMYLNTPLTIDEIAQRTGRTYASIDACLGRLGIRQRQKHRPYTEEERAYIKSVIKQKSLREIAYDLNRSYDSVRQFIRLNGIRRALTKQEREAIIAERLNVTQNWNIITYDVVVKFGITTNKHALYQRWCYYTKNKGVAHAQIPPLDR